MTIPAIMKGCEETLHFHQRTTSGKMEPGVFPIAPGCKALLDWFLSVPWVLARIILENLVKIKWYYVPKLWDYFRCFELLENLHKLGRPKSSRQSLHSSPLSEMAILWLAKISHQQTTHFAKLPTCQQCLPSEIRLRQSSREREEPE